MRLFETTSAAPQTVVDVAQAAGVALTTGGRASYRRRSSRQIWTSLPTTRAIPARDAVSRTNQKRLPPAPPPQRAAAQPPRKPSLSLRVMVRSSTRQARRGFDNYNTGRGTALFDANHDGLIDIVYGNWESTHRLFVQSRDAGTGAASFADVAPAAMAAPSRVRTVIVADFDNDGHDEIFFNNIPGANRLFRRLPTDSDWTMIDAGAATDADGYGTVVPWATLMAMDGLSSSSATARARRSHYPSFARCKARATGTSA